MPEGHEHHGVIAHAVAAMAGSIKKALHLGLGEEVLAAAIDCRILGLAIGFPGHSVLKQLRAEGYPVRDEDVIRLAPTMHKHINMNGRYSFAIPESVARGELRPLRNPSADDA
jgi:Tn3 transposase DDE domain